MTVIQKRKLLLRLVDTEKDIKTLKDVRMRLASSEFVSASMSSGGGSKSYTRADLSKINELIETLSTQLKSIRSLLCEVNGTTPKQIMRIWL